MKKNSLHKEVRAVLAEAEYEALLRLSGPRSRNFAETIRALIRAASARSWEDAAAPRLKTLTERVEALEDQAAHLAKRQEDTIAILRSVEQVLLGRLDGQDQLLAPLVQMMTLTTLRLQAILEYHPKPEVLQRFQQLLREVGA